MQHEQIFSANQVMLRG